MFNHLSLLKAIAATGCPRPLTHLRTLKWYNSVWPEHQMSYKCGQACIEGR